MTTKKHATAGSPPASLSARNGKPYPHHKFADIFPLREGPSLVALSDHIRAHGQKERIVLFNGEVLAGRRRQIAAIRAGVEPLYRNFGSRPEDGDNALEYAFTDFFRRDDITKAERQIAAANYADFKKGFNPTNGPIGPLGKTTGSRKEAAELFGLSETDVKRAKAVKDKGVPELQEAMRAELVSVSDAAAIADETPDVQKKAVKAVKEGTATTLKGAVAALSGPAPEVAAMLARDLERWIGRLETIVTAKMPARDKLVRLFRDALPHVRAL